LTLAQIAYNNKTLEIIGKTLFYANYRRHLNLFTKTLLSMKIEKAIAIAKELKEVHKELKKALKKAQ
jgi:hypothetical protein